MENKTIYAVCHIEIDHNNIENSKWSIAMGQLFESKETAQEHLEDMIDLHWDCKYTDVTKFVIKEFELWK